MSKMSFAPKERIHVKLECLHMLAKLKLDRARTRLISGFIDTYLRLNKEELKKFEVEIKAMAKQEQEEVLEIVTSWMEDGIKQGLEQGLEQGLKQGQEQGLEQGLKQGQEQGSHKTAESLVLRLLTRRLGRISKPVEKRVKDLTLEQLELLSEDLLDFTTIDDLKSWLADC